MKIELVIPDTVAELLAVLDPEGNPENTVLTMIDHAQQAVYRPGSWQREWIGQAFTFEWTRKLEPGDPYRRGGADGMFERPRPEFLFHGQT